MSLPAAVYRHRNPQLSDYYHCVEDYFETFVGIYDEHFSRQYGFWRPYIEQVIYRYLDCGDLHNGLARVKCKDCGHEYLLAFSCKRLSLLSFLPSEAGGGIRGVAVHGCPQESSSPAFCLQIRREKSSIRPTMGSQSRFPRLWNGSPCVRTFRTGVGRWCGIMASKTLLEASVQMVILTSITNRKPLLCR